MRSFIFIVLLSVSVCRGADFDPFGMSGITQTSPLYNKLALYFKLDETSGDRTSSWKSFILTNYASVTSTNGKISNAALFTAASTNYLAGDPTTTHFSTTNFTIACWAKLASKGSNRAFVAKDDNASFGGSEYMFGFQDSSDRFFFQVQALGNTYIAKADAIGSPLTNVWYFLVGWFDAGALTANIKVNDQAVNSAAVTLPLVTTGTTPFSIGANVKDDGSSGSYMDGAIDEVGIWTRVLSIYEMQILYQPPASTTNGFLTPTANWSNNVPSQFTDRTASVSCNGTNQYVALGTTYAHSSPSLMSVWFYPSNWNGIILGSSTNSGSYVRLTTNTNVRVQTVSGSGFKDFTVPAMSQGNWYNLIVYRDASLKTHVYLNGTESVSGGQTMAFNTIAVDEIGKYFDGSFGLWFAGLVSEFQSYFYVPPITAANIALLSSGHCLQLKPTGRFPLWEGSGTNTVNLGFGNPGNAVTFPRFGP